MTTPPKILVKLLDHPTRRAILRRMLEPRAPARSPSELSKSLGVDLGTVSYHVRVLARDGGLQLHGALEGRGNIEHFYVAGSLVKAFPEFVAWTLLANVDPPPAN
jgi:DNA-binding transcriptional ArsR family regulator